MVDLPKRRKLAASQRYSKVQRVWTFTAEFIVGLEDVIHLQQSMFHQQWNPLARHKEEHVHFDNSPFDQFQIPILRFCKVTRCWQIGSKAVYHHAPGHSVHGTSSLLDLPASNAMQSPCICNQSRKGCDH